MIFDNASSHIQHLMSGQLKSIDLTNTYLSRIESINSKLNAIVAQDNNYSRLKAEHCDRLSMNGEFLGPLHGLPVTVKESFNIKGFKTTVNYAPLKNYIPSEDSILVKRLKKAGAIILGKTNVPTLLTDSQTFGPLFPTCNNPYDTSRTPGGSTGGGAAAVASGMSTFEIGSDIGGSIRNPSHYCGLFGLKPTQNGHITDGHVPPLPNTRNGYLDMNCTGPLARSMSDIELAYDICFQPRWDYLSYLPVVRPAQEKETLAHYRIAWFDEIIGIHCSSDTKKALEKMVSNLERAGAKVEKIKLDPYLLKKILSLWSKLFGFVLGQDFNWPMRQMLKMKFGLSIKGSKIGDYTSLHQGLSLNFKHFSAAQLEQQEAIAEFTKLFDNYDFLLSPTSCGPAFKHNPQHKHILIDGDPVHYTDHCFAFVMPYNVLRLPVLNVPTGLNHDGLPIGLSFIGPHYTEKQLIHFGKLLEEQGYRFTPPDL